MANQPVIPVGASPDFIAGWNARAVADGTAPAPVVVAPVPPPAPVVPNIPPPVVAPPVVATPAPAPPVIVTPLAPLQRWLNQVHIAPGPYVPANLDPMVVIQSAKAGDVVSFPPRGKVKFSGSTKVPDGVSVYFNGSDVEGDLPAGGSGSNFLLGAGCLVNGPHITKGYTLFNQVGRGAQVHNFFIDDYRQIAPGPGLAGQWGGVKNRAFESLLVDKDQTPNLDVQVGWVGVTELQGAYLACTALFRLVYFAGTPFEYDFRTEVTGPQNLDRCQKILCDSCTFRYITSNGKGSTVGARMGKNITFFRCLIESNARVGQQPAAAPWPADAKEYVDGCTFDHCQFVSFGAREAITSLNGATVNVKGCEFWVDQNPASIAIAPKWNSTTVTDCIVHVPPKSPWHRLTNSDAVPGTGTVVSTDPYVLPPIPMPF